MIIYFSNRHVRVRNAQGQQVNKVFGDRFNAGNAEQLRMCISEPQPDPAGDWPYRLIDAGGEAAELAAIRVRIRSGDLSRKWLVFLHGNNQEFEDNVKKCQTLHAQYGVNVIAFSWPSHPPVGGDELLRAARELNFDAAFVALLAANMSLVLGGVLYRKYAAYIQARANAYKSRIAFNRCLRLIRHELRDALPASHKPELNFMSYSLGNYVLQTTVQEQRLQLEDGSGLFGNCIMCEADVDRDNHELWVADYDYGERIYITHNEYDIVLASSDIYNKNRLGNTPLNLIMDMPVRYVDFTEGEHVGWTHALFSIRKNVHVRKFFQHVFNGEDVFPNRSPAAATGFKYLPEANTYILRERVEFISGPPDDTEEP
jgi:hypothetical protein